LIDGQQRLTTIYILLFYFDDVANMLYGENKKFNIEYETRENSKTFLKSIQSITKQNESNINYYYMSNAYLIIKEWFENAPTRNVNFFTTLITMVRNRKK